MKQNNSNIILIGAGGHTTSCIDVIEQEKNYLIQGLVGTKSDLNNSILGYSVIGTDSDLRDILINCPNAIITVGHIKNSELRENLFNELLEIGYKVPSIISPKSYVSKHAIIGAGTIVMHGAIINAGAVIGNNCIINTNALIEHGVKIGNNCHISTNSTVNGDVLIGDNCFIGSCSSIREGIRINNNVFVAMCSLITKDLPKNTTYIKKDAHEK